MQKNSFTQNKIHFNLSRKIIFFVALGFISFQKPAVAQQNNVSFQVFYDQLSPYGEWVDYSSYGYVWIPDAGSDFVPYSTNGHWVLTDYGWTWVSDYSWGWAPFHYGRWNYDNYYGWLWVPDNIWGPSWVTWRSANGYYGWAPMESGLSISMSFGRGYNSHNDHWIFVRDRDFERSDVNRYNVNRTDHDRIIRSSTVINKTYIDNSRHTTYITGPARADVQRVTGRKVNSVAIQDSHTPGQNVSNGRLNIYRPQMSKNNVQQKKPTPVKVTNLRDVKRPSERTVIKSLPANQQVQQTNRPAQQPTRQTTQPAQQRTQVPQQRTIPNNNNQRQQQQNTVAPQRNNAQPVQRSNPQPSNNNERQQHNNTEKRG